jgi:hypothetical protein
MKCTIKNLARRPVSIHCNSGKTYHLPAGYKYELPKQEVVQNPGIKKLQDRKIIAIHPPISAKSKLAKKEKKPETVMEKPSQGTSTSKKKTHKKKLQSTK